MEQHRVVAFHDGEDRWAKYSLNGSIRREAVAALHKMRQISDVATDHVANLLAENVPVRKTLTKPAVFNVLQPNEERLMSFNFSGTLNEQFRGKYQRIEGLSSSSSSFDVRGSIWSYSHDVTPDADRIIAQMFHVSENYRRLENKKQSPGVKSIYVDGGFDDIPMGQTKFEVEFCLVNACRLTSSPSEVDSADMRLFQANGIYSVSRKPPGQIWAVFLLESPANTAQFTSVKDVINWTATYRWDSTIVTPYAKFMRYRNDVSTGAIMKSKNGTKPRRQATPVVTSLGRNYAAGKTKMVAWFVSNCYARNKRREYVEELAK